MLKEIEIQVSSATTLKTMIEYHDHLLNVRVRASFISLVILRRCHQMSLPSFGS
jgi:hypothetical protein